MFKFDVVEELKSREAAKKSFPNYFRNSNYDYNQFLSEYIKHLEAYFNDEIDNETRNSIKRGHDYIDLIFLRNNVLPNNLSVVGIVHRIWEQYVSLVAQIANYRFDAKSENSKGGTQNKITSQILDQLSLFDPLIHDICIAINDKIKSNEFVKPFEEQLTDNKIKDKLDVLFNNLNDIQNKLYYLEISYHEAWDDWARPSGERISVSELGKNAKEWQLARNEACQIILNFVAEMVELAIVTYYGTFDYKNEQYGLDEYTIQKINYYNQCLRYLKHSNNYFCYLDSDDKHEIAMQKILKKSE